MGRGQRGQPQLGRDQRLKVPLQCHILGLRRRWGWWEYPLAIHGWDKEHSRVMHGFTFAACTWDEETFNVRTQTFIFLGITTR